MMQTPSLARTHRLSPEHARRVQHWPFPRGVFFAGRTYSSHKAVVRRRDGFPVFVQRKDAQHSALREFWLGIDPPRPNRVQRKVSLSNSRVSVSRSDLGLFCAPRVLADLARAISPRLLKSPFSMLEIKPHGEETRVP